MNIIFSFKYVAVFLYVQTPGICEKFKPNVPYKRLYAALRRARAEETAHLGVPDVFALEQGNVMTRRPWRDGEHRYNYFEENMI